MNTIAKLIVLLSAAILLSSCCTAPAKVEIPLPTKPIYPRLTIDQDAIFDASLPAIYQIVGKRDQMCRAYSERLIGLIQAHSK